LNISQEDYAASVVTNDPNMLSGKLLGRDGHSERAIAYVPELVPKHVKMIEDAEKASKFFVDDSLEGLNKYKME
jgi:hypothetical protein